MTKPVIYTEKNDCQDCYKCIKQCPVKSIKIEENSASVINDFCVYCGKCIKSCPVKAKKYREDFRKVQWFIDSGEKVVACIAPSFIADFPQWNPEKFFTILHALGFTWASEIAIGAEMVAEESLKWLNRQPDGVYISSCCPSVVNLIGIYHPELLKNLVPVYSPMVAHTKRIKQTFGSDVKTVFIGPCIAKKEESDQYKEYLDAAITFQELDQWINEEKIDIPGLPVVTDDFVVGKANRGNLFPVEGGMISTMDRKAPLTDLQRMTFSGIENIKEILSEMEISQPVGKLFLELLLCEGGCIKGPGSANPGGLASKRRFLIQSVQQNSASDYSIKPLPNVAVDISKDYTVFRPVIRCIHPEKDIQDVLNSMGKWTEKEELNCSGCGYDNCREFAKALLDGKAERTMCISYMRKIAQNKASVLLQKIPSGVVMVDENLKIIDCNRQFAELLGKETVMIFDSNPGMAGADLRKLVSFHKLFSSLLLSGEEKTENDIREGDNYYHVSVVNIQNYKIACGIIQNLRSPEIQKEVFAQRINEVVRQNMEAVQRIAYLLGENASFTEATLNSITDSLGQSASIESNTK